MCCTYAHERPVKAGYLVKTEGFVGEDGRELGVDSGGVPHVRFQWQREGRGKEKNGPFRMSRSITFPSANTAEPLERRPAPSGRWRRPMALLLRQRCGLPSSRANRHLRRESTINSLIFLATGSGETAFSAFIPSSQTSPFIAEQTLGGHFMAITPSPPAQEAEAARARILMDQREWDPGPARSGLRGLVLFLNWRRWFCRGWRCIKGSLTSTQSTFGWANRAEWRPGHAG